MNARHFTSISPHPQKVMTQIKFTRFTLCHLDKARQRRLHAGERRYLE